MAVTNCQIINPYNNPVAFWAKCWSRPWNAPSASRGASQELRPERGTSASVERAHSACIAAVVTSCSLPSLPCAASCWPVSNISAWGSCAPASGARSGAGRLSRPNREAILSDQPVGRSQRFTNTRAPAPPTPRAPRVCPPQSDVPRFGQRPNSDPKTQLLRRLPTTPIHLECPETYGTLQQHS